MTSSCPLGNNHCCRKGAEFSKLEEDLQCICFSNCACIMCLWKKASYPVWLGVCYCYGTLLGKVFSKAGWVLAFVVFKDQQREQNSTQALFCGFTEQPDLHVMWTGSFSIQVSGCLLNDIKTIPVLRYYCLPLTTWFFFFFWQTCRHAFLSHATNFSAIMSQNLDLLNQNFGSFQGGDRVGSSRFLFSVSIQSNHTLHHHLTTDLD